MPSGAAAVVLIVDVANVMGSRPDGWWRDRLGSATRWLADLDRLPGATVTLPDGSASALAQVVAVVEGQARGASAPDGSLVRVVRAQRDGDSTIVEVAEHLPADVQVLVVTADRGLRARLPPGALAAGPGWLRDHLP